jgi:hypothetical protein
MRRNICGGRIVFLSLDSVTRLHGITMHARSNCLPEGHAAAENALRHADVDALLAHVAAVASCHRDSVVD